MTQNEPTDDVIEPPRMLTPDRVAEGAEVTVSVRLDDGEQRDEHGHVERIDTPADNESEHDYWIVRGDGPEYDMVLKLSPYSAVEIEYDAGESRASGRAESLTVHRDETADRA